MIDVGFTIAWAHKDAKWPGTAGVTVSPVILIKGLWRSTAVMNDANVASISSYLDAEDGNVEPYTLASNYGIASTGTGINGAGFVVDESEYSQWIAADRRNTQVLRRYLTSQDMNSTFDNSPTRYVVDFGDRCEEDARLYHDPFEHVRLTVKPQRDKLTRQIHEHCFWKHWDRREEMYAKLRSLPRALVLGRISKHHTVAFADTTWLISDQVVMFLLSEYRDFSILQSTIHSEWVQRHKTTMRLDTRYSVSTCFLTYPFPRTNSSSQISALDVIGDAYHHHRRDLTKSLNEGLTDIYNRFHEPAETRADIQKIRQLHVEMDNAVAAAYGWSDLDLGHGFHETKQGIRYTISEPDRREVLARLLKLNHDRYAEEVKQGLHEKKGRGKKGTKANTGGGPTLFDMEGDA